MQQQPKLALKYFAGLRSRGELPRMIMAHTGLKYEEIPVTFKDWHFLKGSTPTGSLPVLDVDGVEFGETNAIVRYLGKLTGLYPSDNLAALKVDSVCNYVDFFHSDYSALMFPTRFLPAFKLKQPIRHPVALSEKELKFFDTHVPLVFNTLEQTLERSESGGLFYSGNNYTTADFWVLWILKTLERNFKCHVRAHERYPKIHAMCTKLKHEPNLANYLAKRPHSRFNV